MEAIGESEGDDDEEEETDRDVLIVHSPPPLRFETRYLQTCASYPARSYTIIHVPIADCAEQLVSCTRLRDVAP